MLYSIPCIIVCEHIHHTHQFPLGSGEKNFYFLTQNCFQQHENKNGVRDIILVISRRRRHKRLTARASHVIQSHNIVYQHTVRICYPYTFDSLI